MANKFYITTAIDYVNGKPHIGHAFEKVIADAISRYEKQKGKDVFFMTGVDENAQKNVQAAEKAGVLAFGQASNQEEFCPNAHLTAIEDIWGPYYAKRAKAVVDGTWSSQDTWEGMADGMVVMSPYNKKLMSSELIQEAINMEVAIKDGSLHSFAGPIYNQAGELVVPAGQNADDGMLAGMSFYVQGIDDELPQ